MKVEVKTLYQYQLNRIDYNLKVSPTGVENFIRMTNDNIYNGGGAHFYSYFFCPNLRQKWATLNEYNFKEKVNN